ncbi:MAG TPA: cyanophycin synthetase, partial [Gemmatimonadales bacterium]|nr:cyanophycin synthetase [Gemmatimonadales bacterium]
MTAGLDRSAMVHPDRVEITADGRPRVRVDGREFVLGALGEHQAGNAMFAWAVARELGIDPAVAAAALEHLEIPGGRGELIRQGKLTVLHDAYNANPESFEALINLVRELRHGRRLVFVAGTMRELGDASPALHARVAAGLATLNPDVVGLIGERGREVKEFID